ncbi:hypothetical protein ACHHYP_16162 [Achlya hypogyna]|uniref:FYVE-type domain-containing protein n=1 Tax=Achlya hypogyna TaxID=1202772 RepID=A0A1V9Y9L4_ACHHY|nr:hypothetical protein ACHHYP_16162 [Achlya hypogyna]
MASVPPKYFHCPPLHASARAQWVAAAQVTAQDTLVNALKLRLLRVHKVCTSATTGATARIFKGSDGKDPSIPATLATTQVLMGSLEDVAAFFELSSLLQHGAFGLVNGQTLYTLADKSPNQPLHYVGMHWLACSTSVVGVSTRDYCVLEYQDEFVYYDEACGRERRGWLRCLHSIATPSCPSLRSSHGLIRGELFRTGHLFIETDTPGVLDYHYVHCAKYHGTLPHFLIAASMVWQVSQALTVQQYCGPIPLADGGSLRVRKRSPHHCARCSTKFSFFGRPRHCNFCYEAFCKRCCRVRGTDGRICAACEAPQFTLARSGYEAKVRQTQATDRTTTSSQASLLDDVAALDDAIAVTDPMEDLYADAMEGTFTFTASSRSLLVQKEGLLNPAWDPTAPAPPSRPASTKKRALIVLYEDPSVGTSDSNATSSSQTADHTFDDPLGTSRLALQSTRSQQLLTILRSKYDAQEGGRRKEAMQKLASDLLYPAAPRHTSTISQP